MSRKKLRRREAAQQIRIVDYFSRSLSLRLEREMDRVVSEAARVYPHQFNLRQHRSNLHRILLPILQESGQVAARRARVAIRKANPFAVARKLDTEEELRHRIVDRARSRAAERIVDISNTTRTRVNNAITRGLDAGEDQGGIEARIREIAGMSRARARTIARTECHQMVMSSQNDAMQETAEELDLKIFKIWVATDDDSTRESHLDADGQKVELDETFSVGDAELLHPGDPEGPPEEVINCRCGIVYET